MKMFDCSEDMLAHHDEKVTLPEAERTAMCNRRDANRDRVKKGLAKADKPTPYRFKSQGSYAMRTMVQHPDKDYDIDDGVYFWIEDLVGPQGGIMSSLDARWMVRDAVDDGSFKRAPEVRKNCVRVFYNAGYHVDLPVYRTITEEDENGKDVTYHELASSTWTRSDACDVTGWFNDENNKKSPDTGNGRQVRRTVRQLKAFARSRSSWSGQILSGFGITVLAAECFCARLDNDDQALHDTMEAIRDRLDQDLVIKHPCTDGATITNGDDDAKAKFLRSKLDDALRWLEALFDANCTRNEALACWDKVFCTTYFSERGEEEKRLALSGARSIATSAAIIGLKSVTAAAVASTGGGRHA